jgi:phosphopantothenoylcysteine decarboxylase/phosphopantothenate--cysteine ligase
VVSTEQMRAAVMEHLGSSDVVVMAAAVADFRPSAPSPGKIKKDDGVPELALEPTADILREVSAARRQGTVLVGFAAETSDVEAAGSAKLERKGLDVLVANEVGRPGTGFGAETNRAAILDATGAGVGLRTWTKPELAAAIVDRIVARLG